MEFESGAVELSPRWAPLSILSMEIASVRPLAFQSLSLLLLCCCSSLAFSVPRRSNEGFRHSLRRYSGHRRELPYGRHRTLSANLLDDVQDALPPQRVLDAIRRGGRYTAADVSASAGTSLKDSQKALTSISALLGGDAALEVSNDGDIVYQLPADSEGKIAAKSRVAAARRTWEATKPSLYTAARIAFGVGLIVSIVAVYSAVIFLSTSSSSDDRRDDRRSGSGGGGFIPNLYYGPNIFDVFYYRPYRVGYLYSDPRRGGQPPEMGLLESVYSYVFGDGNPNADIDSRVIKAAAMTIRASGGAVTAEQLLPFVPEPPLSASSFSGASVTGDSTNFVVDESCVLPIVERLQGVAEVSKDGKIVYVFNDMAVTAAVDAALQAEFDLMDGGEGDAIDRETRASTYRQSLETAVELDSVDDDGNQYLQERTLEFSAATGGNLFLAGALGVLNLVGAGVLGAQLASLPPGAVLPGEYGVIQAAYPLLLAYAVAFNVTPLLRSLSIGAQNSAIESRNRARRMAAVAVKAAGPKKFTAAQRLATGLKQVMSGDVAFSSSENKAQSSAENNALDDFDRRLNKNKENSSSA